MFRYVLTLMLVSAYSGSLGVPLKESTANGSLAPLLVSLANRCHNVFLSEQIKDKLNDCNIIVPPYNEQQFVCMMFYDINKHLCDAVAQSKLNITAGFTSKMNEEVDLETTCDQAKNWPVSDLLELPNYKEKVTKVLKLKLGCVKVCGVEDVTSQDTNFFCKYFKWGSESLNTTLEIVPVTKDQTNLTISNISIANEETGVVAAPVDIYHAVPIIQRSNENLTVAVSNNITDTIVKSNVSDDNISVVEKPSNPIKAAEVFKPPVAVEESAKGPLDIEVQGHNSEKPSLFAPNSVTVSVDIDRPLAEDVKPPRKEDEEAMLENVDNQTQIKNEKEIASEKNKSVDQVDPDYQDSEEGREGMDGVDDNGDDPMVGGEVEAKPELNQKATSKKFDVPLSFVGERVNKAPKLKKINKAPKLKKKFYANTMPDQYATDDDHFFPLFLTGVIMVVLLYVLYHNKSKVSKVFLGLIVEGRQPGRRRNSRGHAYKRLDTLEQAMSTSTAAPPSKIIY